VKCPLAMDAEAPPAETKEKMVTSVATQKVGEVSLPAVDAGAPPVGLRRG
jgi:hypothetical protein